MAIRPADLQAAYLATPQNAAIAGQAQSAPQVAQQAAQSAFAAQVRAREEAVEETDEARGTAVHARSEGEGDAQAGDRKGRNRKSRSRERSSEDGEPLEGSSHLVDIVV